jgi:hypothetical protein
VSSILVPFLISVARIPGPNYTIFDALRRATTVTGKT